MKKFNFLSLVAAGLLIANTGIAQEMIVGGDMESADAWSITTLNSVASSTIAEDFGYTADAPTAGVDGCFHLVVTRVDGDANSMVYQAVDLVGGVEYTLDLAFKNFATTQYWFETYIGVDEPGEGADYGSTATALTGFKFNEWEASCTNGDVVDGTLATDGCLADKGNTFTPEADGTYYVGFKAGLLADGQSFEIFVDNVSLMGSEGGSSIKNNLTNIEVFPTQFDNELNIQLSSKIKDVQIVNLLGQTVSTFKSINSNEVTLDVSEIASGIYYVTVIDENNQAGTAKAIKL